MHPEPVNQRNAGKWYPGSIKSKGWLVWIRRKVSRWRHIALTSGDSASWEILLHTRTSLIYRPCSIQRYTRRHPSGFVWRRGRISGMAYSNPTFLSRPRHSISDKTPAIYFFQLTAPCRDLWLNNRSPPKNLSNKICHDTPVQLKLIYNIRCLFYSRFKWRINKNYNR